MNQGPAHHRNHAQRSRLSCRVFLGLIYLVQLGCASESHLMPGELTVCDEDRFGAESGQIRAQLKIGHLDGLRVCPGAPDRFGIEVGAAEPLDIHIEASGEISVVYEGAGGQRVEQSGASLRFRMAPASGVSLLTIRGQDRAYSVHIESVVGAPCADALETATVLATDRATFDLCANGTYWVRFEDPAATVLDVGAEKARPDTLKMELYVVQMGWRQRVASKAVRDIQALELSAIIPVHGQLVGRFSGTAGAPVTVSVTRRRTAHEIHRLDTQVQRLWREVTAEGLQELVPVEAALLRFDIVDEQQRIVSTSVSDEMGRLQMAYPAQRGESLTLRIVSEAYWPGGVVRVGPEAEGDLPWTSPVWAFEGGENAPEQMVLGGEDSVLPTFHIAQTAAGGLTVLAQHLPADAQAPPLYIYWRPGTATECGTCFLRGDRSRIELSGRIADPDEWDTAVILHEVAHYVVHVFSRDDSPGGAHGAGWLRPEFAWSEGLATFISSFLMNSSVQLDYRISGVRVLDIELDDLGDFLGTSTGELEGGLSEYLVAGLLWDLFDAPDDDDDLIQISAMALLGPLFQVLPFTARDMGAPGVDLADYLNILSCEQELEVIQPLVDSREYPLTLECLQKSASFIQLELKDSAVHVRCDVQGLLTLSHGKRREIRYVMAGETLRWPIRKGDDERIYARLNFAFGQDVNSVSVRDRLVEPDKAAPVRWAGAYQIQSQLDVPSHSR